MARYLIEFRFFGQVKQEMRSLIYAVDRKFRLHKTNRRRPVPHITLAGPFRTDREQRLVRDFKRLCRESDLMRFRIGGYGTFDETSVVFVDIAASQELDAFRWRLSQTLKPYCELTKHDLEKDFAYHATIAMKIPPSKFKSIKTYVLNQKPVDRNHILTRVALLKNSRILYEYDFLQKKLLTRDQALSREYGRKTRALLSKQLGREPRPDRIPRVQKGLLERIKEHFQPPRTYVCSDLHLDHANIIKYCKRPFRDLRQMNEVLVENWNRTVRPKDTVYFLGDMAYGRSSRNADYWLERLNGKVIFIKGNHEGKNRTAMHEKLIIEHHGESILLIHDDKDAPEDWNGWIIHGHHHNNKPEEHPLINTSTKRMNVSVEFTDYKPILLDELLKMRFTGR
jgi:calcineurin-like phosphoesterase family protein/2'-5' RNA ligase